MQKKQVINTIVLLVIGILLFIGLSYGYFFIKRNQDNNNVAGSKCFKLELSKESEAINLSNMYPISDEEGKKQVPYSFTITNTCDMLAGYTVNMEMLEGTTLNSKYLDVMVNNEEIKLLSNYEATDTIISGSTESRVLTKGTLAYNDSVDYTVRFWMDKDVEDIESMNKYFTSKIVVVATPSTWNPKDAGYDTLHDAILANEYQSSPEEAISKIEAKGEPDLSKIAPIIKWTENTVTTATLNVIKPSLNAINVDEQTSELTENDTKLKFYTKVSFDSELGLYTLTEPVVVDPTALDYNDETKYYFTGDGVSYNPTTGKLSSNSGTLKSQTLRQIWSIQGASSISSLTTWNNIEYESITYKLSATKLNSIELEIDNSEKGLYKDADDYGETYYYRGNVKNNNVYFAGFYWQIVRINGDGSIRLLYNGTEKNSTGYKQSINNKGYQFNNPNNHPAYVGYMYGDINSTVFDEVHANINDSTVKAAVDEWFKTSILDKGYKDYLSLTTGFCGDRSLSSGDGIQASSGSSFGAEKRLRLKNAQFICPEPSRDLYTTNNSDLGNKSLKYPVGLISSDEAIFAGMNIGYYNRLSWIYSSVRTWTMSPSHFYKPSNSEGQAREIEIDSTNADVENAGNGSTFITRPVINLKEDVKISSGIGTVNDPFVIDTNN